MTISFILVLGIGIQLAGRYVAARDSLCGCSKRRRWYFGPNHEKVRHMAIAGAGASVGLLGNLAAIALPATPGFYYIFGFLMFLISTHAWLAVYYHEKDKMKKAAKALGKVFVMDNGKLGVQTNG